MRNTIIVLSIVCIGGVCVSVYIYGKENYLWGESSTMSRLKREPMSQAVIVGHRATYIAQEPETNINRDLMSKLPPAKLVRGFSENSKDKEQSTFNDFITYAQSNGWRPLQGVNTPDAWVGVLCGDALSLVMNKVSGLRQEDPGLPYMNSGYGVIVTLSNSTGTTVYGDGSMVMTGCD